VRSGGNPAVATAKPKTYDHTGQIIQEFSLSIFIFTAKAYRATWTPRVSTAPNVRESARSTGFGDGREFDEIRDGSHELFSPAKIKMEGDGVSVFRSELSWNVVGNM
jgi:hypothetical protein